MDERGGSATQSVKAGLCMLICHIQYTVCAISPGPILSLTSRRSPVAWQSRVTTSMASGPPHRWISRARSPSSALPYPAMIAACMQACMSKSLREPASTVFVVFICACITTPANQPARPPCPCVAALVVAHHLDLVHHRHVVGLLVCSSVRSFVRLFVRPFVCSFVRSQDELIDKARVSQSGSQAGR